MTLKDRLRSQNSHHDEPPFHRHASVCDEAIVEIERLELALRVIVVLKEQARVMGEDLLELCGEISTLREELSALRAERDKLAERVNALNDVAVDLATEKDVEIASLTSTIAALRGVEAAARSLTEGHGGIAKLSEALASRLLADTKRRVEVP